MALGFKPVEDPNMAVSRVSYYDALKKELERVKIGAPERAGEVEAEIAKAGPDAVKELRALQVQLEARGDSRARAVKADAERIEADLGKSRKVERAASTQGGDAGNSRAAS